MEAEDEFNAGGAVHPGAVLLEVVKHGSDQDAGEERPGDAEFLEPGGLHVGEDEVSCPHFHGADAALVGRPGLPGLLHSTELGDSIVLGEVFDGGIVVSASGAHKIERGAGVVRLIDVHREYYS